MRYLMAVMMVMAMTGPAAAGESERKAYTNDQTRIAPTVENTEGVIPPAAGAPQPPEQFFNVGGSGGGPLDLGATSEWLYQQIKERGVLGLTISIEGDTAEVAAMKVCNIKKYMYCMLGARLLNEADPVEDARPDTSRFRFHAGIALDLLKTWGVVKRAPGLRAIDFIQLPASWELLGGVNAEAPTLGFRSWQPKSHVLGFLAFRKRLGAGADKK